MSTPEENKAIVRKAIEDGSRGGDEGMLANASDSFKHFVMMDPPYTHTKSELLTFMNKSHEALEGGRVEMTIQDIYADFDYVVAFVKGRALVKTGFEYRNRYCLVWKVVDGKIESLSEHCDPVLADGYTKALAEYFAQAEGA